MARTKPQRVRDDLLAAQKAQSFVRIKRRLDVDGDITGFVFGVGTKWVLLASLSRGRFPDGYELIRLEHVKKVRSCTREHVHLEQRILEARGDWPLKGLDVDLDNTRNLVTSIDEKYSVVGYYEEVVDPGKYWVGTLCRIRGNRALVHSLEPHGDWEDDEPLDFRVGDISRLVAGDEYLESLRVVCGPHPDHRAKFEPARTTRRATGPIDPEPGDEFSSGS